MKSLKRILTLAALGFIALGTFWTLGGPPHTPVIQEVPPDENLTARVPRDVWVVENDIVIWRPLGAAEKAFVGILSFGTALDQDWVQGRVMPQADARSFRGLSRNYGVDKNAVWYQGEILPSADPASFQVADFSFARDKNTIWRGGRAILPNPASTEALFEAFSPAVFRVGAQGYYFDKPLPETPQGLVTPFCRDWYAMNGALWLARSRIAPLFAPEFVVTCDASTVTRNGQEIIAANRGITWGEKARILTADLNGTVRLLYQFDAKIARIGPVKALQSGSDFMLLQLVDGEVLLADYSADGRGVQSLGHYESLNFEDVLQQKGELWLGGDVYLIVPKDTNVVGVFVRQVDPAALK